MLSGSRPPGSSNTPANGKIGSVSGSCAKLGSNLLRPITTVTSREQDGREALAAGDRERIGEAERLEELQQLLARRALVPGAVCLDHVEQLVDRLLLLVAGPVGHRKVEAALEVLGIGRGLGLQLADRPGGL